MRLDRHGAVATTQRDRVFVLFDLLQRQPFGKHLLRLPEYVTNRRCCRSLVARHDPSSSPTPICRERLSPCNCVPCRAPPTCLSPIHRQSILGTTSSPPREPAMQLSENVSKIEASGTLAIAALCRELRAKGRDILDLGIGEPDFRTPEFIAQAGIASIEQGMMQYPPVPGLSPLREAIARFISAAIEKPVDPAGVVVSSGAKQALFNACFALFGPGDEVFVPVPYWTSYPALVRLARTEPRFVRTEPEDGFKVSVAMLEKALTPRVRGIILNSPSNPTGAVYSRDELTEVVRWAQERDLWIISDEIYARICFDAPRAPSVLDVCDSNERVVLVDGASKAFAMTGWRLGFSYTTKVLADQLTALQ